MVAEDMWQLIHTERAALAADLAGLTAEQWEIQSLCDRWTVRDVVAHMTATAMMTPAKFMLSFARSGFSFPSFADKEIGRHRGSTPQETLERFRAAIPSSTSPPGPAASWIGEAVVHAEDARRPLNIPHAYSMEAMRRVGTFFSRSNAIIGSKKRVAGVRLEASDTEWATGTGPTVRGPMLALLMTMTGRSAFVDDLAGEGLDVLRDRLAPAQGGMGGA
jgi:uncharacterized protein (TIGR03083 family)